MDKLQLGDAQAAAVAVAPRVTLADIEANIDRAIYLTGVEAAAVRDTPLPARVDTSLACLTLCLLVTKSGWTIVGTSACASPENFNAELGRKLAYEDAVGKLWGFMGFALKERLAA